MRTDMDSQIVLTAIQLLLARPETADLRRLHHYAAETGTPVEEVSYLVKLYIDSSPIYDSTGFELYVGEERIRKYSQFTNGIYFVVNDPRQLSALGGQEVRFRRPGSEEFIHTGVIFPEDTPEISRERAEPAVALPPRSELLRE
jgi:hypothetical protein